MGKVIYSKNEITFKTHEITGEDRKLYYYLNIYYNDILIKSECIDKELTNELEQNNAQISSASFLDGTYKTLIYGMVRTKSSIVDYTLGIINFYQYNGKNYILDSSTSNSKTDLVERAIKNHQNEERKYIPLNWVFPNIDRYYPEIVEHMLENDEIKSCYKTLKEALLGALPVGTEEEKKEDLFTQIGNTSGFTLNTNIPCIRELRIVAYRDPKDLRNRSFEPNYERILMNIKTTGYYGQYIGVEFSLNKEMTIDEIVETILYTIYNERHKLNYYIKPDELEDKSENELYQEYEKEITPHYEKMLLKPNNDDNIARTKEVQHSRR